MRNQTASLLSDPIKYSNIAKPPQKIDNLPDIDYYNIKKAAMILRSLNHMLRQQVIKTIHQNKKITVKIGRAHV